MRMWLRLRGALSTSASSSCLSPVSAWSPLKSPEVSSLMVFQFPLSVWLSFTYKAIITFSLKFPLCGPSTSFCKFGRQTPKLMIGPSFGAFGFSRTLASPGKPIWCKKRLHGTRGQPRIFHVKNKISYPTFLLIHTKSFNNAELPIWTAYTFSYLKMLFFKNYTYLWV